MRLLLVEDDAELQARLKAALQAQGWVVDVCADGREAVWLGSEEPYDAAVLDLGLPTLDGVSVLHRWREADRRFPVLLLTARSRWADKLAGFGAGADDYLTKPVEIDELILRLKALIRRSTGHAASTLACGPLELDTLGCRFRLDGAALTLTAAEYRVLAYLIHHAGRTHLRPRLRPRFQRDRRADLADPPQAEAARAAAHRSRPGFPAGRRMRFHGAACNPRSMQPRPVDGAVHFVHRHPTRGR